MSPNTPSAGIRTRGLSQAKRSRPVERAAFAADHLLYGLVLSEMRARPRD